MLVFRGEKMSLSFKGAFVTIFLGLALVSCSPQDSPPSISDGDVASSTGEPKEFIITAKNWEFVPNMINVKQGDEVVLKVKSADVPHGFFIEEYGIDERLEPNKEVVVRFIADKKGEFPFVCSVPCGKGHGKMRGVLIVK